MSNFLDSSSPLHPTILIFHVINYLFHSSNFLLIIEFFAFIYSSLYLNSRSFSISY